MTLYLLHPSCTSPILTANANFWSLLANIPPTPFSKPPKARSFRNQGSKSANQKFSMGRLVVCSRFGNSSGDMASLQRCDYHENVLKNGREHPRQRGLSTQSFLVNEKVRPFDYQFWQLHLPLVIQRERERERERFCRHRGGERDATGKKKKKKYRKKDGKMSGHYHHGCFGSWQVVSFLFLSSRKLSLLVLALCEEEEEEEAWKSSFLYFVKKKKHDNQSSCTLWRRSMIMYPKILP